MEGSSSKVRVPLCAEHILVSWASSGEACQRKGPTAMSKVDADRNVASKWFRLDHRAAIRRRSRKAASEAGSVRLMVTSWRCNLSPLRSVKCSIPSRNAQEQI